ncbi:MAG: hypothetical protein NC930_01990, partial [Candidatus Omnitrophica bacterium]|nr:hypothetical protein [Candidatus Omnitrophota bacterium]
MRSLRSGVRNYGLISEAELAVELARYGITLEIPRVGASAMNQTFLPMGPDKTMRPNFFALRDPQNQVFVELAKTALVSILEEWGRRGEKTQEAARARYRKLEERAATGEYLERFNLGNGERNLTEDESDTLLAPHRAAIEEAGRRTAGVQPSVTDNELIRAIEEIKVLRKKIQVKSGELFKHSQWTRDVRSAAAAKYNLPRIQQEIENLHAQIRAIYQRIGEYGKEWDANKPGIEMTARTLAMLRLAAQDPRRPGLRKIFSPVFYTHHEEADLLGEFIHAIDYGIGTRDQHANFNHRIDGKDVTFNLLVDFVTPFAKVSQMQDPIVTYGLAKDYLDGVYPDEVRRVFLEQEYAALTGALAIKNYVDHEGNPIHKKAYRDAAILRLPDISTREGLLTAFRLFARAEFLYQTAVSAVVRSEMREWTDGQRSLKESARKNLLSVIRDIQTLPQEQRRDLEIDLHRVLQWIDSDDLQQVLDGLPGILNRYVTLLGDDEAAALRAVQSRLELLARSEVREKPIYFIPGISATQSKPALDRVIDENAQKIRGVLEPEIKRYLTEETEAGTYPKFPDDVYAFVVNTFMEWLTSPALDRYTKLGLLKALQDKRWKHITKAFSERIKFGTAGPRGMAAITFEELSELEQKGFQAIILKGPNTINNVTLALLTTGVARSFKARGALKGSITFDSRTYGKAFADYVAAILVKEGLTPYIFDQTAPMPEMSFSVPNRKLDFGILISASHNAAIYNGYKVVNEAGAQLDPVNRKSVEAYTYGKPAEGVQGIPLADIGWILDASVNLRNPLDAYYVGEEEVGPLTAQVMAGDKSKVVILGEHDGQTEKGLHREDIHNRHAAHVISHILQPQVIQTSAGTALRAVYSAFYGNGTGAFMRIMERLGLDRNFQHVDEFAYRRHMDAEGRYDYTRSEKGTFPLFSTRMVDGKPDPIIPDPGNSAGHALTWEIVIQKLIEQHDGNVESALRDLYVLMGNDPDADRAGVAVTLKEDEVPPGLTGLPPLSQKAIKDIGRLPEPQRARIAQLIFYLVPPALRRKLGFSALRLLSANDTWTLLTKYRIDRFAEMIEQERIPKGLKFTIVKTHVTTDALAAVADYAKSKGIEVEVLEPFVGFSLVAELIQQGWEEGKINISGQEESGGFSIGGAPNIFFTLAYLFRNMQGLEITREANGAIRTNQAAPLLGLEEETYEKSPELRGNLLRSYFGYSLKEIDDVLEYLTQKGVLVKETAESQAVYRLNDSYRGIPETGDYWKAVRPFAKEAPCDRLGKRGHTLEKDGLLADVLVMEVAAYAKSQGLTFSQFIRENLYRTLGYFSTTNQALEFTDDETGKGQKIKVLRNVLELARRVKNNEAVVIDGKKVSRVEIFIPRQQKYADSKNFPVPQYQDLIGLIDDEQLRTHPELILSFFPEEGVRFYFDDQGEAGKQHLTIRPSGTEAKLRFYVQWLVPKTELTQENLTAKMLEADQTSLRVALDGQALAQNPSRSEVRL